MRGREKGSKGSLFEATQAAYNQKVGEIRGCSCSELSTALESCDLSQRALENPGAGSLKTNRLTSTASAYRDGNLRSAGVAHPARQGNPHTVNGTAVIASS